MNKKEILKMLLDNDFTCDDLVKKFSKSKLSYMYTIIFNGQIKPPANYKKCDIAYKIIEYCKSVERTRDLCKLLH